MKELKLICTFIGAIVGAGFATGRELNLFFNDRGIFTILLSGFFIGIFAFLYMYCGKNKLIKDSIIEKTFIFFTTFLTYTIMIMGAEELVWLCFNVRYIGLITGIVVGLISGFNFGFVKILNTILVPLIFVMIAIIRVRIDVDFAGAISFKYGFMYATMNMLLAGYICMREAETLSIKSISIVSTVSAVAFTILILIATKCVSNFSNFALPMLAVADFVNLRYLAGVIIYVSIFTTLICSANILNGFLSKYVSKNICSVFLALLSIVSYKGNFSYMVDNFYPLISLVGIFYTVLVILKIVIYKIKTTKSTIKSTALNHNIVNKTKLLKKQ